MTKFPCLNFFSSKKFILVVMLLLAMLLGPYGMRAQAQCNSGLQGSDIGGSSPAGTPGLGVFGGAGYATVNMTAGGAGAPITWAGTSDQFYFAYVPINGNATLIAQITSPPGSGNVGLMVRNDLTPGSAMSAGFISGTQIITQDRTSAGGSVSGGFQNPPTTAWVKLVRAGNTVTYFTAPDGVTWTLFYTSAPINFNATVLVGLALYSGTNGSSTSATLSNVCITGALQPTFTATNTPTQTATPCITSFTGVEIPAGVGGSANYASGTFTLSGAGGTGIFGTNDSFYFGYVPMSGNGDVVVHMDSLGGGAVGGQGGLMIRNNLTTDSAMAFVGFNRITTTVGGYVIAGGPFFMTRPADGGDAAFNFLGSTATLPYYLKLNRAGNIFTASVSSDGTTWVSLGSTTVTMNATVYVGLAATAERIGNPTTASFDSFCNMSGMSIAAAPPVPTVTPILTVCPNPCQIKNVTLTLAADDSWAAYINGNQVPPATNMWCYNGGEQTTISIPISWFVSGKNVIATTNYNVNGSKSSISYLLDIQFCDNSHQFVQSDGTNTKWFYDGNTDTGPFALPPNDASANSWTSIPYDWTTAGWNSPVPGAGGCAGVAATGAPWMSANCNPGDPTNGPTWSYRQEFAVSFIPCGPTSTYTQTATIGASSTATATATATASPTMTYTIGSTSTATASATSTSTATNTITAGNTPTETETYTAGPSQTPTNTGTPTATASDTATVTNSPTASVTSTPTVTGSVTVTVTNSPTISATRTQTLTSTPLPPKLLLKKSVSPAVANQGDIVTYTLLVQNLGLGPVNLQIWDTVPLGLDFVSAQLDYSIAGPSLYVWSLGNLAPGQTISKQLVGRVQAGQPTGSLIGNTFSTNGLDSLGVPFGPLLSNISWLGLGRLLVYPNPFKVSDALGHELKFVNVWPGSVIEIWSLSGRLVKSINVINVYATWDGLNDLKKEVAPGTYFYVIHGGDTGQSFKGKIILQR